MIVSRSLARLGVVSGACLAGALLIVSACGSDKNPSDGPGGAGTGTPAGACQTPAQGCPCAAGTTAPCGVTYKADQSFLYCYEGTRSCENGAYGACQNGSIVTVAKSSLAFVSTSNDPSGLHPATLGVPTGCVQDPTMAPLMVCVGHKKDGDVCTQNSDCAAGIRKCSGSTDSNKTCRDDNDCNATCVEYLGNCVAGAKTNWGCNVDADCPGSTCNIDLGGATCQVFMGICNGGANDGHECNINPDCPGGACESDRHGRCEGGKRNDKKCRHDGQCHGGSCTAENGGLPSAIDPCDPNCNVVTDTPNLGTPGFTLSDGGLTPAAGSICGDSIIQPTEQCDDGNTTNGDGCSSTCQLEVGYFCPMVGMPCAHSTCGNGVIEGLEQCDDGPWAADSTGVAKDRPYDGCFACQKEVNCPVGAGPAASPCVNTCGDGIKSATEACDDGNSANGDGCSSTCTVEPGATCMTVTAPPPPFLDVPVIYRDFDGANNVNSPDFQMPGVPHGYPGGPCNTSVVHQGIPQLGLSTVDKEPVFLSQQGCVGSAATYATWYHDGPTNKVLLGHSIRLKSIGPGSYQFDSSADPPYNLPNINCGNALPTTTCASYGGFFPINALGFGNFGAFGLNFGFTSEVRYPFTYAGGETLSFTGDDDVEVFIGGRKVVDIGGIHAAASGAVTLGAGTNTVPVATPLGLVPGNSYEIDVFQAERNTVGSNYKLTLAGFNQQISQCVPPTPPRVYVRDFEGICPPASGVVWQLFRWQAGVPAGATIDFRAATADTIAALPPSPPAASPTTVPIGQANTANSPPAGPFVWTYDTNVGPVTPRPVSQDLTAVGATSKHYLRVYMTFTGPAVLYQWQQLYDCVPNE